MTEHASTATTACPHCVPWSEATERKYPPTCRDHGVGYVGIHGIGCDCACICGPEACDDGGEEDDVEWCTYCAALDPSLPCPADATNGSSSEATDT